VRARRLHPAASQYGERDAHHLRPVTHHRARDDRRLQRQSDLEASRRVLQRHVAGVPDHERAAIIFFAYFYTSIIFNPVDLDREPEEAGGFIPGVKPGAPTADYIDDVLSRITFPGAIFLTIIAMLPIVVSTRSTCRSVSAVPRCSLSWVSRSTPSRRCSSTYCCGTTTGS